MMNLKRYVCMKRKKLCFIAILTLVFGYYIITLGFHNKYNLYIPVFVVEEHHEALHWWIDVAHEGGIPKSGNTLIHIDGHSDDGLPHYVEGYPFFRWPWTNFEVDLMMQQNDVFIVAGTVIGLIDRIIWITPAWNNETKHITHTVNEVDIGSTSVVIHGEERTVFCKCEPEESDNNEQELVRRCVYFNESFDPADGTIDIELNPPSLCKVMRSFTFEIMTAKAALEYSESQDWFSPDESVILDIDEDYFGCEIPGQMLYDVGINWDGLQFLNKKLAAVFCPKIIQHEKAGAEILSKFIHLLIKMCDYGKHNTDPHKICKKDIGQLIRNIFVNFLEHWKQDALLFCATNDAKLNEQTADLVEAFYDLPLKQLNAILKLGFCFNTTPRTIWFDREGSLVICHGNNDPDKPMVQVYVPESEQELQDSLSTIHKLLQKLPQPNAVTVCRSIRDGYTSRKNFRTIENSLVNYFRSHKKDKVGAYNEKDNLYEIIYDENLLNMSYGLS